jgi:hypothetical protein
MAGMAAGAVVSEIVVPLVTSVIAASSQQSSRGVAAGMSAYKMMQERAQANAAKGAAEGYSQATNAAVQKEMQDRQMSAAAPGITQKLPASQGGAFVSSGGAPTLYGNASPGQLEAWRGAAATTPAAAAANPGAQTAIRASAESLRPAPNPAAASIGGDKAIPVNQGQLSGEALYDTIGAFKNVIGAGLPPGTQATMRSSDTRNPTTLAYQEPSAASPGVEGIPVDQIRSEVGTGEQAQFTGERGVKWTIKGQPYPGSQPRPQGPNLYNIGGGWSRRFNPDGSYEDIPPPQGYGVEPTEIQVGRDDQGRLVVVRR